MASCKIGVMGIVIFMSHALEAVDQSMAGSVIIFYALQVHLVFHFIMNVLWTNLDGAIKVRNSGTFVSQFLP